MRYRNYVNFIIHIYLLGGVIIIEIYIKQVQDGDEEDGTGQEDYLKENNQI